MSGLHPPKLTVRIIKRRLGDHFLDFMNFHNPNGFMPDEDAEIKPTTLSGIVMLTALEEAIPVKRARRISRTITNFSLRKIKLTKAREIVAIALGYKCWSYACAAMVEEIIPNKRLQEASVRDVARIAHGQIYEGINLYVYAQRQEPLPEGFEVADSINVHLSWVRWHEVRQMLVPIKPRIVRAMDEYVHTRMANVKPCLIARFEYEGKLVYVPWTLLTSMNHWRNKHALKIENALTTISSDLSY
jgi:hypothetical protein